MQQTRFDTRLLNGFTRTTERLASYVPVHAEAAIAIESARRLLAAGPPLLKPALERAAKERQEAYLATERVREAEADAEQAQEPLVLAIQGAVLSRRAADPKAGAALQRRADRTVGPWSPSAFQALGLERTAVVLDELVAFATEVLGESDATVVAAAAALKALREAMSASDREAGEAIEAVRALENARDEARILYLAARDLLSGALRLDRRDDQLGALMPPLHVTRRSSGATEEDEDSDLPSEGPTPAPPSEPTA